MQSEPPSVKERSAKLLAILRRYKGWCTCSIIAAQLGSGRLDGRDFVALNVLVERRLIEMQSAQGDQGRILEYRFIETSNEADTPPLDRVR